MIYNYENEDNVDDIVYSVQKIYINPLQIIYNRGWDVGEINWTIW